MVSVANDALVDRATFSSPLLFSQPSGCQYSCYSSRVAMAGNVSDQNILLLDGLDVTEDTKEIAPSWVLLLYLGVVVGGGVVGSSTLACAICRQRCNKKKDDDLQLCKDTLLLLLCLAIVDIGMLMLVAPFEVLVLGSGEEAWNFSEFYCPVFLGLEVMLGSASVYLLVALNIHAVLVRTGDDQVVFPGAQVPVILVWVIAISLSIPQFTHSRTVVARPHYQICTLHQDTVAYVLLATFRLGVPVFVMLVCSLVAALRLCGSAPVARPQLLRVVLILSLSYATLSLHRAVFSVLHVFVPTAVPKGPDAFKVPPLANIATSQRATLVFAMIHYALCSLRPVFCCMASSQMRYIFAGGCCCCCCCSSSCGPPHRNRPR